MTHSQQLRRLAKQVENEADLHFNGDRLSLLHDAADLLRNLADELEAPKQP
jgi:hypothetical protein